MISSTDSDTPKLCQPGGHDWENDYYGKVCRICGTFWPDCYFDEDEGEPEERGTCEICGGEWGDGWSNCTCEYNPDDPTLNMTIEEMRQSVDEFDKAAKLAEEGM